MRIRAFGTLRSAVGGHKVLEVAVCEASTVQGMLDEMGEAYPSLARKLLDEGGRLLPGVNVFVNGRSARLVAGLSTPVRDDDAVALFPPLAGG